MSARSAIGVLLGGLAALSLAAPVAAIAASPATTPSAASSSTPATTPSTPTGASTPTGTSSPAGTGASGESTPAPPSRTTVETTVTLPGRSARPKAPQKPAPAGREKGAGGGKGGAKNGTKNGDKNGAKGSGKGSQPAGARLSGPRAPAPSALTPPLPLAFSSSLGTVPGFFIESFRIPPFLLPIFQAAGTAYGVPWQVLAAINEVETDYGRDLSVSSAGAEGWMQFLPSSWAVYGVDANGDGFKDPYNPADAIFAAARYLRAAGAATNLRGAIYAYNHSQAYVESVILRAKLLGGTPSELLGAITGLTQARFPVHAPSYFSDGFQQLPPAGRGAPRQIVGTTIYSQPGAPVIAVQDGRVLQIGDSPELGRFISLRDAYGNTYTYAQLGRVARLYPVLKPHEGAAKAPAPRSEAPEPRPTGPASAGSQPTAAAPALEGAGVPGQALELPGGLQPSTAVGSSPAGGGPALTAPAVQVSPPQPATPAPPPAPAPAASAPRVFRAGPNDVYLHPLRAGVMVIAGTVLGHVGAGAADAHATVSPTSQPHVLFQIRPAGVGAPLIDPKPILDGWVALENSSLFRPKGAKPSAATAPTPGQVLLESKQELEEQVRANPQIQLRGCARADVQTGQVDRRVLATLEYLAVSGLAPTVASMSCVRAAPVGPAGAPLPGGASVPEEGAAAFDISAVNGIRIAGHQGPGSIMDTTVRKLLTLQGSLKPQQIVSQLRYPGTDNTLVSVRHPDRIHVAFQSLYAVSSHLHGAFSASVSPSEWIQLIARLGEIPDPRVQRGPSAASIPDQAGAASANGREAGGHN
jgi:Transglycosylase SLT domain